MTAWAGFTVHCLFNVCIAIPKRVLYAIKTILINPVFYIQRCSIFSKIGFAVKITDVLIAMYAKFIPISTVESFVLFPFTGDYLNPEMLKIFYLLGVY